MIDVRLSLLVRNPDNPEDMDPPLQRVIVKAQVLKIQYTGPMDSQPVRSEELSMSAIS